MPLKRHPTLQPFSHDHHHGLVFCRKLEKGLSKNISIGRIESYARWFFITYLKPHFELEEQYIFTLLNSDHPLTLRACEEHQKIYQIFKLPNFNQQDIENLIHTLKSHIRFEERDLFATIQENTTEDQLIQLNHIHNNQIFKDNLTDPFWQ